MTRRTNGQFTNKKPIHQIYAIMILAGFLALAIASLYGAAGEYSATTTNQHALIGTIVKGVK